MKKIVTISFDEQNKELARLREHVANGSSSNAFIHSDRGEIDAIEDIINILINCSDNAVKYIKKKAKERLKNIHPYYSSACDKCNADTWYQIGYVNKIKKVIGINIKQKRNKSE